MSKVLQIAAREFVATVFTKGFVIGLLIVPLVGVLLVLTGPRLFADRNRTVEGEIAVIDPDYIVCWGSCAAQNLLDTTVSIGKLRGKFHAHGRAKVLCTYHPSYLLRNPAAKKDVWEDIKFFRKDMGVTLT